MQYSLWLRWYCDLLFTFTNSQHKLDFQGVSGCTGRIAFLEVWGWVRNALILLTALIQTLIRSEKNGTSIHFFSIVKSGSFPSGGSNSARICHQSIILTRWQIIGLWEETGLQKGSELEMDPEPSCYSASVCILRV